MARKVRFREQAQTRNSAAPRELMPRSGSYRSKLQIRNKRFEQ